MTLILVKCDNNEKSQIPVVFIDFSINIQQDVEYYNLQAAGNSQIIDATSVGLISVGYDNNGIIIYNAGDAFHAFDRTCPHEFPVSIAVDCDGGGSAECPECGSIYVLPSLGVPAQGSPSKFPLKEYRVEYFSATGVLHVYN